MKNDTNSNILDIEKIAESVSNAISKCYGVVGIAKKSDLSRPDIQLKKGKKEDAIYVKKNVNHTFSVDVYLIFSSNVKITEALSECQKTIMYTLNKSFNKACRNVNVFAEKVSSH